MDEAINDSFHALFTVILQATKGLESVAKGVTMEDVCGILTYHYHITLYPFLSLRWSR